MQTKNQPLLCCEKESSPKTIICLMAVITAAILFISTLDYQDEQLLNDNYCSMVADWNKDAKQGIAPADRAGHPNYKQIECN